MSRPPRCTACKIALEPGAERCPQCLRKSTVVSADGKPLGRLPFSLGGETRPEEPESHAGIRALALLLAYAAYGPLLWLIFSHEKWLEAHALWLPSCFAVLVLATMPLRMAFAPPDEPMDAARAKRHYAFRMLFVLGMAAGLFTAQAIASQIVSDPVVTIFVGMLFFLAPLLVVPAIVTARREKRSIGAVFTAGAKGIAIAVGIVVACAVLVALRAASHPPPKTIYIPMDPPDSTPSPSSARPAR